MESQFLQVSATPSISEATRRAWKLGFEKVINTGPARSGTPGSLLPDMPVMGNGPFIDGLLVYLLKMVDLSMAMLVITRW